MSLSWSADVLLNLDENIRVVRVYDEYGKLLDKKSKVRIAGSELMPDQITVRWGGLWFTLLSDIAGSFEKFYGPLKRAVFHFEKLDALLVKSKNKVFVVTVEKTGDTELLAKNIEKTIRSME